MVSCSWWSTVERTQAEMKSSVKQRDFYGYVDLTDDGRPFYVGIGNQLRFQKKARNSKHTYVRNHYGFHRELWLQSSDWTVMLRWEVDTIAELKTFHDENELGCNFTRGGDGSLGWKPSAATRAKWSEQRRGNTNSRGPRPNTRGRKQPWVTAALKGRKRPDLAAIALGKNAGPTKSEQSYERDQKIPKNATCSWFTIATW